MKTDIKQNMLTEQLGYGKGSHLHREFAEVMALKHTDSTGDLWHIFSLVDGHDPTSVPQAQNQKSLFLSRYI